MGRGKACSWQDQQSNLHEKETVEDKKKYNIVAVKMRWEIIS